MNEILNKHINNKCLTIFSFWKY